MDNKHRFGIQAAATLLQNANFKGFFQGGLYSGPVKQVCVPGLNCYSCPGAVGACPIGSLQSFLDARTFRFPYYVVGLLIFFGALLGRAVCGFLCPFGWIQELIGLIPVKKRNRFRLDPSLRWVKYGVLAVLVIGLPLGLKLVPYFCKYLCPSGTLAGWMLAARDSILRSQLGALFTWKSAVLIAVITTSLFIWRPFCKYLCPLGAIYGLFNRVSLVRMELDRDRCVGCGACAEVCRMCVDPSREPNSAECIRCGDCVRTCPMQALQLGVRPMKKTLGRREAHKQIKNKSRLK